jgi:hypothetical protein
MDFQMIDNETRETIRAAELGHLAGEPFVMRTHQELLSAEAELDTDIVRFLMETPSASRGGLLRCRC